MRVLGLSVRGLNHSGTTLAALIHTLTLSAVPAGLTDAIASAFLRLVLGMDQKGFSGDSVAFGRQISESCLAKAGLTGYRNLV